MKNILILVLFIFISGPKCIRSEKSAKDDRPESSGLQFAPNLPIPWHKSLVVSPDRHSAKIFINSKKLRRQRRNTEPRFNTNEYQVVLNESIPINTTVLQVRAIDNDRDTDGIILYELRGTSKFWIDTNGIIFTKTPLDYESSGGSYRFSVTAKNPTASSVGTTVPVVVNVRDTPEVPQFDSSNYEFSISEFSNAGDYVGTVVARDPDNDMLGYSLADVAPHNLFVINRQDGIITIGSRPNGFPQYRFNFHAVATDRQGHVTRVPVSVNIIDENTNKPIFENCSGYNNFVVAENQSVPHNVLMVKATDADHGKNGEVEYSLLNDPKQFSIDKHTGQLTVRQRLDRDNGPKKYFLTVIAKDLAENSLQNSCAFTLVVGDINDNSPVFDSKAYIQTVPSDTLPETRILRLTASDADDGNNARLNYSLLGSTQDLKYFSINPQTGYITLSKALSANMANRKSFNFTGKAVDNGSPPLSSTVGVTLRVVSAGDMPPSVISQTPQVAKVLEDAKTGTNVVTICARSNSASNIVYMDLVNGQSPETNSEGTFEVTVSENASSKCSSGLTAGNIFVATANLDYEEITAYTITVQLTNDVGARSEHSLEIAVVDVNDNPPVFQEPYSGSVSENSDPKTLVMQIQTIDKDASPQFRQLHYSFKNPITEILSKFYINEVSGELWTKKTLDREQKKHYHIPISVTDGVNHRDRRYWVVVNDQNDEPPVFNRKKGIYDTKIYENLSVGKDTGIKLFVEDPDILNKFTYQIVQGNEQRKFDIDSTTGMIFVKRKLDYDAPVNDRNFTLQVRVSDGKSYNTTAVKISVLNVNDMPPQFEKDNYGVEVVENKDCNKKIIRVVARDPDYPLTGKIKYHFSNKDQRNFTIDENTGDISVVGCLDRETVSPFGLITINPFAYDEDGKGLNSKPTTVTVRIKDVNDNHPYIESPPQARVGIMENVEPSNAPKTTILLNDWDSQTEGNGCPCTLAFHPSTPPEVKEYFNVEGNGTYQLVLKKSLDREKQKSYVIPFLTTDQKGMSGIRHLTVTVGDQNDSPMSDGISKITVYNYMSSFPDMQIGFVYVTDADDYDVGDKTFQMHSSTDPIANSHFYVNTNTGNLTMRQGTPSGEYIAVVQVNDNVRKEEAKGTVHVRVIDLPEEAVLQSGSFLVNGVSSVKMISQTNLNVYEGTSLYDRLKNELGIVFKVPPQNVDLFTLQDVTKDGKEGVEVRFNVHSSPYYTASHVNGLLQQNKRRIESNLGIQIPVIDYNLCLYENYKPCNGSSCQQELRPDHQNPLVIGGETSTIVGVKVTKNYTCMCGHLDPLPKACPHNYCYNGGVCAVVNGSLSCTCPDSHNYGPRCELLTARLRSGFAWFEPLNSCENPSLNLKFQTEKSSALLLYNGPIVESSIANQPRDFLYMVMRDWTVEAYLDLGARTAHVSVKLNPNPNESFDVHLSWTSKILNMTVPNCGLGQCSKSVSYNGKSSLLNVGGPLQLGGLAPMSPLRSLRASYRWDIDLPQVSPFDGCFSLLKYNDLTYDMNRTSYNDMFSRTCSDVIEQPLLKMSNESVYIIVGSLLLLLLLVILLLLFVRRQKKTQSYPDHLNEIVKETMGQTDIEGYGERDMTQYDLKCLRVTPDGQLINGHGGRHELPDVTRQQPVKKAPIARLSEGLSVGEFIADNTKKIDKELPDFDDVRHYCYEGDKMSIASLSSLGSGTSMEEPGYNLDDWGPRFKELADIYRPKADEDDDSEYEFPTHKPPKPPKPPKPIASPTSPASSVDPEMPYQRLGKGNYNETINPLAYSENQADYQNLQNGHTMGYSGKESWC